MDDVVDGPVDNFYRPCIETDGLPLVHADEGKNKGENGGTYLHGGDAGTPGLELYWQAPVIGDEPENEGDGKLHQAHHEARGETVYPDPEKYRECQNDSADCRGDHEPQGEEPAPFERNIKNKRGDHELEDHVELDYELIKIEFRHRTTSLGGIIA